MTIQVTLNGSEFNHTGTYEGREYTSLRVNYTGNGRIYFTIIKDQMKLSSMAKQMKFEDGKVYVSFGKQGKLYIGTYIDDTAVIEDTQEAIEEDTTQEDTTPKQSEVKDELSTMTKSELRNQLANLKHQLSDSQLLNESLELSKQIQQTIEMILIVPEPKLINNYNAGNYSIDIFLAMDTHNNVSYKLIFTDISTGLINEDLSDTVYMSEKAALKTIESFQVSTKELPETKQDTKPGNPATKKQPKQPIIPIIDMTADYAKILYTNDNQVNIIFTNDKETNTITFNRRKSWGHKKYIDKAIEQSGINPSWQFRYGWEYISNIDVC